jgi:hypothetical protein
MARVPTIAPSFAVLSFAAALSAQIAPGNVLVVRVGDGTAALTNAATAVFLDEYTPAGGFVQAVALPTATAGANRQLTMSGTATSEGALTQSVDGRFLIVAGYGANPGAASIASSTSSAVPRVCARIGLDEAIDSSTALADAYSANNVRGAASWFGAEFWTAGTASAANGPGVRFAAVLGASTSTQLNATVTNIRRVDFWNGQLFCTSATGSFFGVGTVGTGAPTGSNEAITLLAGMPTATGPSPYDFFFANASTLYVADDRANGSGGIQKWTLAAGSWTLQYTLAPSPTVGCRGLSGFVDGAGVATLFATTTGNQLVRVVDTGITSPITTIATGAANTALRGVRFVRTPASITFTGSACSTTLGPPSVGTAGGDPVAGNAAFQITCDNALPGGLVLLSVKVGAALPIGIPLPGGPLCSNVYVLPDVLAVVFADSFGAAALPVPLPAGAALGGTLLAAQSFALDPGLVGFDLPFGNSDAMQLVIGN